MLAVLRIVIVLVVFLSINLAILLMCIVRPFHRDNVYVSGILYSQLAKVLGVKVIVQRSAEIKSNTPYVYIANHQNSYDLITICRAAFPGVVTVGKKSLKWIPVFGQIYWLTGNIMIDRKNSGKARDTINQAASTMKKNNKSIWFFPEGTRSYGRGLLPFKVGAFRLAQAVPAPLVMVCASELHNKIKWNRWNNGFVLVDVSAPQELTTDISAKEWMNSYHDKMAMKIAELNETVSELEKVS